MYEDIAVAYLDAVLYNLQQQDGGEVTECYYDAQSENVRVPGRERGVGRLLGRSTLA